MAIGIGTTAQVQSSTTDSQSLIQGTLGFSTIADGPKKDRIIDSLKNSQSSKENQYNQMRDLVLLADIDLDMYDELIVEIDRKIPPLLPPINDAIQAVDDAYEARITQGVRSDLKWEVVSTSKQMTKGGANNTETTTWKCVKNDTREQINFYAVKYYKTPKDRDYGGSSVRDISDAQIEEGSTVLISNQFTKNGNGVYLDHLDIQVGDTITDSIETPQVFDVGSLPEVVGLGSTTILGVQTTFGANITIGSTVLAYTGINTTAGIEVGDTLFLDNFLQADTKVVGFGTTTTTLVGISTLGIATSVEVDTTSVIIDKLPSNGQNNAEVNVGIFTDFPTITLSDAATGTTDSDNFHVLRFTDESEIGPDFDVTRSGEQPVEVGLIEDDNKIGYGRSIYLVNNGDPKGTKTFEDFVDPEPAVGGSFCEYYVGNFQWPIFSDPNDQVAGDPLLGYTQNYATEGQVVVVVTGAGATEPSATVGYLDVSEQNPSQSVKDAADALIVQREAELVAIKAQNIPKINDYISKSFTLREIRDDKQSQAWNYRRGQGSIANDIKKLKTEQNDLNKLDLGEFE